MLIVVVTGLLLQVKKEFAWIQPPTERGVSIENRSPLSLDKLLKIVREVPEAQVAQWSDIDRFDIRPARASPTFAAPIAGRFKSTCPRESC